MRFDLLTLNWNRLLVKIRILGIWRTSQVPRFLFALDIERYYGYEPLIHICLGFIWIAEFALKERKHT